MRTRTTFQLGGGQSDWPSRLNWEQCIGAIDVQSSERAAFSADDERLMTIFCERAALVLEHSRFEPQTETRIQQLRPAYGGYGYQQQFR